MLSPELATSDRVISLGDGLASIPERLLLAHARGEVLFICGAGVSRPAGLPDFRELVVDVFKSLDASVHAVLDTVLKDNNTNPDVSALNDSQKAEVRRFLIGDYDVVLGMLERRLDNQTRGDSRMRQAVVQRLLVGKNKPARIHKALMTLADRGGASTIVTTNFDLLFEHSLGRRPTKLQTYALSSIPRPTRQSDFSGVLHIHGALDPNPKRISEMILSDQDFGEFYLRRRVVPDFIYDAARLFNLVLVGYSANDPPMRYLLNAVAADNTRFEDLKERFTFFGMDSPDPVVLEDWKGRGITPIQYNSDDGHSALRLTLERWAELSAINGSKVKIGAAVRRIVSTPWAEASEVDRDLFDHLVRRGNTSERTRISSLATAAKADLGWLNAIVRVSLESEREQRR